MARPTSGQRKEMERIQELIKQRRGEGGDAKRPPPYEATEEESRPIKKGK